MTAQCPRLAAVCADLRDRGYHCPEPTDAAEPIVATGGDHPAEGPTAPLSIDRVWEVTPLSVVSTIASGAHAGHAPMLVVDEWEAADAREILDDPFVLRDRVDGRRQFYSIPERITLTDGRYACVRTNTEPQWREDDPSIGGSTPTIRDSDRTDTDADRVGTDTDADRTATDTDDPRLLLEADGEIQAVLESAAELTCPGPDPAAFPYRYERGPDKRIHVFNREREVGRYAGISAMVENAYRPVSMPLLPEHHVERGGRLARGVTLAIVTDDGITYERP